MQLKELQLKIRNNGDLIVPYKGIVIVCIEVSGKLKALDSAHRRNARQQWVDDGKPTSHKSIKCRGGEYAITTYLTLERIDIEHGQIYDFNDCIPFPHCEDENIKRFSNGTPILY